MPVRRYQMPATMEKVDAAGLSPSRIKRGYPDAGTEHCQENLRYKRHDNAREYCTPAYFIQEQGSCLAGCRRSKHRLTPTGWVDWFAHGILPENLGDMGYLRGQLARSLDAPPKKATERLFVVTFIPIDLM